MKLDEFTEALTEALICRGVPEKVASSNAERLTARLNGASLNTVDAYSSKEELAGMADELSERLLQRLDGKNGLAAKTEQGSHDAGGTHSFEAARTPETDRSPETEVDIGIAIPAEDEKNLAKSESGDGIEFTVSAEDWYSPAEPEGGDSIEFTVSPSADEDSFRDDDIIFTAAEAADSIDAHETNIEGPGKHTPSGDTVSFALPGDELVEYAPDAGMLTSMGLANKTYEAEAIEASGQKDSDGELLPPLPEIYETPEGKKRFMTAALCLSPLIAIAALAYFAAWGIVFAAEAALIVGLIVSVVAVAAAGTLASITGIIYGVVKLSSQRGEGIFEIGLGIVVAGATLLAGILIYNAAIRFMPWAVRQTARLCRLCSRQVRILIRQRRGRFSAK